MSSLKVWRAGVIHESSFALFTSAPATHCTFDCRANESNTRPARLPQPITAMRIRSLAPWTPKIGRVAATVRAAAEAFKNLRLLSIGVSPCQFAFRLRQGYGGQAASLSAGQ